jgi:hypothetical protein
MKEQSYKQTIENRNNMKIIKLFLLSVIASVNLSFFAFAEEEEKLREVRMIFHVKDGKPNCFGQSRMDIDAEDTTVSKMQDTNEFYWAIKEDDSIAFTFPLGKKSKVIDAKLSYYSTGNKSEFQIRCNGQKLETIQSDKAGASEKRFTFTPQTENTLKVKATKGTIGITRLVIDCEEPYPTFEFDNGVKFTLMSPEPDAELGATNEVKFVWRAFGNYGTGWMKLEYRNKDNTQWQSVPGAEGFSPNTENWQGEKGEYTWKNLPKSTDFDFRIVFTTGKNIVEEERRKAQKIKETERKVFSELARVKWNYLSNASGYIDKDLWRKYAKENYDKARKLSNNLENEFADEKNKDEIQDQDKIKQNLEQLEILYLEALLEVLSKLQREEDLTQRNRDRVISKSEDFIEEWDDAIDDADKIIQKKFANETIAKGVIANLFPQERFENFKKEKKRIETFADPKKLFDNATETVLFNSGTKRKLYDFAITPIGDLIVLSDADEGEFAITTQSISKQGDPSSSICTFTPPPDTSRGVFSPDCKSILTYDIATKETTVVLYNDAGEEKQRWTYTGSDNDDPVWLMEKNLIAMQTVIQSDWYIEHGVRFLDLKTGINKIVANTRLAQHAKLSPDAKLVVYEKSGHDRTFSSDAEYFNYENIKIVDVDSGDIVKELHASIASIAFSHDSKLLAVVSGTNAGVTLKIYDTSTWKEKTLQLGHVPSTNDMYLTENRYLEYNAKSTFSSDGSSIAVICQEYAYVFNVDSGKKILTFKFDDKLVLGNNIAFSLDGKWIIIDGFNTFSIWDAISGQEIKKFDQCYRPIFSKDGKYLLYKKEEMEQQSSDVVIIQSESIVQLKLEDNCILPSDVIPAEIKYQLPIYRDPKGSEVIIDLPLPASKATY